MASRNQKLLLTIILPFLSILSLLALGGCAHAPIVNPIITSTVEEHGVDSLTYQRMKKGQALRFEDILDLVQHRVPSHIIIGYLNSTQHPYQLSYEQIEKLQEAGAHPKLIAYLKDSARFYDSKEHKQHTPYFENAPIMYDWYDSPYEESCYSPFSLN